MIHIVSTAKKEDIRFILNAILPKGRKQNNFPIIEYKGYPLAWGIPNENAATVSSPLSPTYTVGQIVLRYMADKKNINIPDIFFSVAIFILRLISCNISEK